MTRSRGVSRNRGAALWRRLRLVVLAVAWLAGPLPGAAADAAGGALSTRDLELAGKARHQALETRASQTPTYWRNDQSGTAGAITPLRTFRTTTGYYCRLYSERTIRGGTEITTTTATACRDDGGVWRTVRER